MSPSLLAVLNTTELHAQSVIMVINSPMEAALLATVPFKHQLCTSNMTAQFHCKTTMTKLLTTPAMESNLPTPVLLLPFHHLFLLSLHACDSKNFILIVIFLNEFPFLLNLHISYFLN